MALTSAEVDLAVPVDGQPSRSLTNGALKELIGDIAAVADSVDGLSGTPRAITGAVTLGPTDVNCTLRFNSGSTAAITLANDATLQVTPGKASIAVYIQGAGVPTFAAGTATIVGTPRDDLAQHDTIVLLHTGIANTWSYA